MNSKIVKTIVWVLALNLVSAGGWWWFYGEIKNKDRRITAVNQEIVLQEAKQRKIKELDQTLQSIALEKSRIDGVFADAGSIVRFIEDLERLSFLSGAGFEIVAASLPLRVEEGGPFFTVNLSGSFGRVFKFLSLLESMSDQIKIESARLAADGGGWTSQIKLRMLSYKF